MDLALPNLHPAVVHFPVVLIPLAILVDGWSALEAGRRWRAVAVALWWVAGGATLATFLAGRAAADSLVGVPALAQPAIAEHADWATFTLAGVVVIAVARSAIAAGRRWRRPAIAAHAGLIAISLLILASLAWTADRGGALVYRHALAVDVPPCPSCPEPPKDPPPDGEPSLEIQGPTAIWVPDNAAIVAAGGQPWPNSGAATLVSGEQTLVLPGTVGDVQLNVWLDVSGFEGEARLLHNVDIDGSGGGGFTLTTGGRAALVRGTDEVFASGTFAPNNLLVLSVSSAAGHFKGMVDGKTVVHGHGPALDRGHVGIRLVGEGRVGVQRVERIDLTGGH